MSVRDPEARRPTVDFDHHSPEYAADAAGIYQRLRSTCPVAYTESHGGYWVLTRYGDVARVARDDATYSSDHEAGGVIIPPGPNRAGLIEMDAPLFVKYRRLLNPWFSPTAVDHDRVRAITTEFIDRVIERGEFDIVFDLASPVPAILTMHVLGLPIEHWQPVSNCMHKLVYSRPGTEEFLEARRDVTWVHETLRAAIAERREAPRDDLISHLVHATVDGERLPEDHVFQNCLLVISGGVDTTTALIANALMYLHRNHEARRLLAAEPDRLPAACEELLRYYSPVQGLARTVKGQCEVGGQEITTGERVWLSWASANRDEEVFPDPEDVVLDRFPNRHTAFGLGAHRCLGSNLARAEFCVVVGEVLRRMPDYRVIEEEAERYPTLGTVNGYVRMPAVFTPGAREGSGLSI